MANEAEFQSADLSAEENGRDSSASYSVEPANHNDHDDRHDHDDYRDHNDHQRTSDEYIAWISDTRNIEKKFPVDRKKLEKLILAGGYGSDTAVEYFQRIMDETGTLILWPSKLKVGAKSKKDPHVKVVGRPEAVQSARERILTDLDAKTSRITLKIDIPCSEHSHVIGKEGINIKRVHEESKCHIHFPDSNRAVRKGEKCSQVSIMGPVQGVEIARQKIRELLPLVIKFCTPLPGDLDIRAQNMKDMMAPYNVMIFLKPVRNSYSRQSLQVTLKGMVCYQDGLKLAISKCLEYFTDSGNVSDIVVELHMEIPNQHHRTVIGNGALNLNKITMETQTTITFPDPTSCVTSDLVIIQGGIDGVLMAREHLIGCLPVVLLFDLHETESETISSAVIGQLSEELDVFISVRPKAKQPVQSAIIKSIEQNIQCVYKARDILLNEANQPVKFAEHSYSSPSLIKDTIKSSEEVAPPPAPPTRHTPTPIEGESIKPSVMLGSKSFRNPGLHSPSARSSISPSPSSPCHLSYQPSHTAPTSPKQGTSPIPSTIQETTALLNYPAVTRAATNNPSPTPAIVTQDSILYKDYSTSLPLSASQSGSFTTKRLTTREFLSYEQKKEEAQKAMKSKVEPNTPRVPTKKWLGDGFSQSWHPSAQSAGLPEPPKGLASLNKAGFQALAEQATLQRTTSAQIEHDRYQGITNLSDLLKMLDLEKYQDNFDQQEVDFATFLTMTEEDLKEIGVSTLGARRKLQIAISEIKKLKSQPQRTNFITSRDYHPSQSMGHTIGHTTVGRMRGSVSHSMRM